ncbi:hypothetical protein BLIG_01709 [Bifidobacterium longum subsp. infantis CCUG 52486]|uniref:Uncharacterized protein n=1 Tax=Bifidobacterium longum subsp. infantis CCUG 52486 TaxID=537937 RepID=C5EBJ1_BIFLI|nr:hypothetical protein BLIG_01709 [Bifidobacterium longum subsp. infantis CCUG 52486]
MGKVDQSDDAVDHGVAQCHQRVHAADFQTVEQLADEHDDLIGHSSPFLSMLWFSTAARVEIFVCLAIDGAIRPRLAISAYRRLSLCIRAHENTKGRGPAKPVALLFMRKSC